MRTWQCYPSCHIWPYSRAWWRQPVPTCFVFFCFWLPHSSGFKFNHSGINRSQPAWPLVCLTNRRAVGLGTELHVWNPTEITSTEKRMNVPVRPPQIAPLNVCRHIAFIPNCSECQKHSHVSIRSFHQQDEAMTRLRFHPHWNVNSQLTLLLRIPFCCAYLLIIS